MFLHVKLAREYSHIKYMLIYQTILLPLRKLQIYSVSGNVKRSTLMGWFLANRKFPLARDISYLDFLEHIVWDITQQEWKDLVKGFCSMIGRI